MKILNLLALILALALINSTLVKKEYVINDTSLTESNIDWTDGDDIDLTFKCDNTDNSFNLLKLGTRLDEINKLGANAVLQSKFKKRSLTSSQDFAAQVKKLTFDATACSNGSADTTKFNKNSLSNFSQVTHIELNLKGLQQSSSTFSTNLFQDDLYDNQADTLTTLTMNVAESSISNPLDNALDTFEPSSVQIAKRKILSTTTNNRFTALNTLYLTLNEDDTAQSNRNYYSELQVSSLVNVLNSAGRSYTIKSNMNPNCQTYTDDISSYLQDCEDYQLAVEGTNPLKACTLSQNYNLKFTTSLGKDRTESGDSSFSWKFEEKQSDGSFVENTSLNLGTTKQITLSDSTVAGLTVGENQYKITGYNEVQDLGKTLEKEFFLTVTSCCPAGQIEKQNDKGQCEEDPESGNSNSIIIKFVSGIVLAIFAIIL